MSKEATIYKGNQTQKDQSKRDKKGKKKLRLKVNDSVLELYKKHSLLRKLLTNSKNLVLTMELPKMKL